jgi:leucyl aminopeptidase (aminopeptidase T)
LTGKEAELAYPFRRHAAGGEVGDQPAPKLDPGVAQVDLVGQDRHADGPDLGRQLTGHREGDLEVMNHQVEDHVDVYRTRAERRQALRLEIANAIGEAEGRLHRWVVILDMPDGEHLRSVVGKIDQFLGLGNRGCDGFLDQYVATRFQQSAGDLAMADCRGRNDHSVGGPRRLDRLERRHPVLGGHLGETRTIRVEGADAADPLHTCQDTNMMATEVAGSDDCGCEIGVCHEAQDNTADAGVQFSGGPDCNKGVDMLDVKKLLVDVFDPQPDEVVTFAVDLPRAGVPDHEGWSARRAMAERWRGAMAELASERDFSVRPMLSFEASGANNADLPSKGRLGDEDVDLLEALKASTLVIAMTEFSATAPLAKLAEAEDDFRAASMPGVQERMEETALAADYSKVAARCKAIFDIMDGAILCDVLFSTGHRCWFDLRHRAPEMDDGFLPRGKKGDRIINLPSGETFVVPYEGEFEAVPSWTAGTIPVVEEEELVLFHIVANTVIVVEGEGSVAERYAAFFDADPARANIAEVAFGVNDRAEVTGEVLEDEKAGFHWAFGRSDHLGGVVGVEDFESPESVIHQDIVYAEGNPVQVERAVIVHKDGRRIAVIDEGEYKM